MVLNFNLDEAARLYRLKRLSSDGDNIHANRLEVDFLKFSSYSNVHELKVRNPSLYPVDGDEKKHLQDIISKSMSGKNVELPPMIDMMGDFSYLNDDYFVILSPNQLNADLYSNSKAYFHNLIETVYVQGQELLKDFTVKEGLFGKVKSYRGDLSLEEIHLFPEKFKNGEYTISVNLDSPNNTISKFKNLLSKLNQLENNSKVSVLDMNYLGEIAEKALDLRSTLGALSRYAVPDITTFSTKTNSYKVVLPEATQYFFYIPQKNINVAVSFGKNYLADCKNEDLLVLNGDDYETTLTKLITLGMYEPSDLVLENRLNNLTEIYEANVRKTQSVEEHASLKKLVDSLTESENSLDTVLNHEVRRTYLANLQPELRDFMIFPITDDILSHELLSRLSWNCDIRKYHDTKNFISTFKESNDDIKLGLLNGISSNLLFNNQQNYDVNNWLFLNQKEFCESKGIQFTVM